MLSNIEYAAYQEWIEAMVMDSRLGAIEIGIAVTATTYGDASNMELVDYCQAGKRAVLKAKANLRDFGYVDVQVGVGRGNRTKISASMPDGREVLDDELIAAERGARPHHNTDESGADLHLLSTGDAPNKVVLKRSQSGSKVSPKCPQSGAETHHKGNSENASLYKGLLYKPPIVPLFKNDPTSEDVAKPSSPLTSTKTLNDTIPDQFNIFWKLYPCEPNRKQGKGECLKLFRLAIEGRRNPNDKSRRKKIEGHPNPTAEEMIKAVRNFAASVPNRKYVPAPKTWLNNGSWLDDVCQGSAHDLPFWKDEAKRNAITDTQWENTMRKHANGTWPLGKLGPAPDHPDCVAPKHIIIKLGLDGVYDQDGIKK